MQSTDLYFVSVGASTSAVPSVARAGMVGVPCCGFGLQGRSSQCSGRGEPSNATWGEGGHRGTYGLRQVHPVPGTVPYGGAEPGSDSPGWVGYQHCGPGSAQVGSNNK